MIRERQYRGLPLDPQKDPSEQIAEMRKLHVVINRVMPVGIHEIPQQMEGLYEKLEIEVLPQGQGIIWGTSRRGERAMTSVRIGDKEYIIVKQNPSKDQSREPLLEISERTPWHAITSFDPATSRRCLWREYTYEAGRSPQMQ